MTSHVRPLIEDGTLAEEVLDRAVERVLAVKAQLGLIPAISPGRGTPKTLPQFRQPTHGRRRGGWQRPR